MEKKILLPVDGSHASRHALDYLGLMAGQAISELKVVLFFVMKGIPTFMRREAGADPGMFKRVKAMEKANTEQAQSVLGDAKARLIKAGLSEDAITSKALPRASDATRDILFEAEQGMYDALVLGRQGVSKAQELFTSSTANRVVQHAQRVPVWTVGGKVKSSKVLAAVDGSDGSLRAIDHMAFMLRPNHDTQITLLHVGATLKNYCELDFGQEAAGEIEGHILQSEQRCMDDFYGRAQKVLMEAGFSPEAVETKEITGRLGVTRTIVDQATKNGYGTVVMGRTGEHKSFLLGHVADKVLARLPEHAVWVVG